MSQKTIQLTFFVLLSIVLLVLLFFILKPFFGLIFISGVFAVSFYPLYKKLIGKFKGRKGLAAFCTTFVILIFVIIPIAITSTLLLKETADLYNSIALGDGSQNLIHQANSLFAKLSSSLPPGGMIDVEVNFEQYTRNILNWIIGNFGSISAAVFGGILDFILLLISLYYLFIFGEKIKKSLVVWSPLPDSYDEEFVQTLRSSIDAVLRGRILVSVAQGVFIGIGFVIFGIGSPVLWGFVGGIASLVPVIGTSVVTVPAIAYLFLTNHIGAGIGLLVWAALAVGLVDNFLSVIFLKNKIKIHPLVVFFSILGGVEAMGLIGFLVGPVVVGAFIALMKIYPFIMSNKINPSVDGQKSD